MCNLHQNMNYYNPDESIDFIQYSHWWVDHLLLNPAIIRIMIHKWIIPVMWSDDFWTFRIFQVKKTSPEFNTIPWKLISENLSISKPHFRHWSKKYKSQNRKNVLSLRIQKHFGNKTVGLTRPFKDFPISSIPWIGNRKVIWHFLPF